MVEGTCRGRPSSSPLLISKCGQPRRMHVSMSCLCVFFPLWSRTDLSCLVWFMFCRCCPLFTLPVYVLFFCVPIVLPAKRSSLVNPFDLLAHKAFGDLSVLCTTDSVYSLTQREQEWEERESRRKDRIALIQ